MTPFPSSRGVRNDEAIQGLLDCFTPIAGVRKDMEPQYQENAWFNEPGIRLSSSSRGVPRNRDDEAIQEHVDCFACRPQ